MMNNLLDTNILIIYLRDKPTRNFIEHVYDPFGANNNPILSIVSVGEIKSLAKRNYWGTKKTKLLDSLLNDLIIADINSKDVIRKYAEIDAFSQGKILERPLSVSSRNMGKNDLWIAATTEVTQSKLLTTDNDFNHLDHEYFEVIKIERLKNKS